jgi:hypothetical protein
MRYQTLAEQAFVFRVIMLSRSIKTGLFNIVRNIMYHHYIVVAEFRVGPKFEYYGACNNLTAAEDDAARWDNTENIKSAACF